MTDEEKKLHDLSTQAEDEVDTDPGDDLAAEADLVFEENTEVTGGDAQAKVQKLKAQIKELQAKNADLLDKWQRDKAEFVNIRKKDEEAKREFVKFAKADLMAELIQVLDSFESAFKNKAAWGLVDKNWRVGVEYIHSQLMGILGQNGLKTINPVGEQYNYARDEAVETVKVTGKAEDGKILEVVRTGYELGGKELRAPKVKVAHFE